MEVVLVVQVHVPEGNAGIGARRPYVVAAERVKVLHAGIAPHHERQIAQIVPHMLPEFCHVAMILVVPACFPSSHCESVHATAVP